MLLLNPSPPTRAQDFRDKGTYLVFNYSPYVALSYPDSTQTVVDGIVTNAFLTQRGTGASAGNSIAAPDWKPTDCGRPRKRRRPSAAQQTAQTTVVPDTQTINTPAMPSPITGVPWWLLGIAGFILLIGLPSSGGGEI